MTTKGRVYLLVFTLLGALAICVTWLLVSAPTLVSQGGANSLVEQEVRLRMARVAHQLNAYRHEHGEFPQDLDQAAVGEITDPWGRPFHYKPSADDDFVLFSVGPDGEANTSDDIRRDRSLDADFDAQVLAEADQQKARSSLGTETGQEEAVRPR